MVAEQAGQVATAWSPADAPPSWRLTAVQFETLRDDPQLLALAATIPPDRLPPLLFTAAATFLVQDRQPSLRGSFPRVGEPQPAVDPQFASEYRDFCLENRESLLALCAHHRYQMNEVGRCADLLPALAPAIAQERDLVLVDLGTGAGLALQLDRYRYLFRGGGGEVRSAGRAGAGTVLETEVRGGQPVPLPLTAPRIVDRIGVDIEPLDPADPSVRAWLGACLPQEIGAVTRFARAVEVAVANPVRRIRGDALTVLPEILAEAPPDALVCLLDSYVHVFFQEDERRRFRALVDEAGATRDIDWVSVDPLTPMGPSARASVQGLPVPPALVERNRSQGVFGLIGRLSYREGRRSGAVLGLAHPGAAWIEWLPAAPDRLARAPESAGA